MARRLYETQILSSLCTGLAFLLVNSQLGNSLNLTFDLADSIEDVITGVSNATYTDVCPESDFQTHSDGKIGKRNWLKLQ